MMPLDLSKGSVSGVLPFRAFRSTELIPLGSCVCSKGNQKKYRTLDGSFYVKEQFRYQERGWRDDLVEVIASTYAGKCKLPAGIRVVSQGLCTVDGRPASYSKNFLSPGDSFISYRRYAAPRYDDFGIPTGAAELCYRIAVDRCCKAIGEVGYSYINTMMLFDLLTCNEDRHMNNFGFILHQDGSLSSAPLFDFGIGMFEGDTGYDDNKQTLSIPEIRLKPFWFTQKALKDFLLDECGSVLDILPFGVSLHDFEFPSELARDYFVWVNERLGVKIER